MAGAVFKGVFHVIYCQNFTVCVLDSDRFLERGIAATNRGENGGGRTQEPTGRSSSAEFRRPEISTRSHLWDAYGGNDCNSTPERR